MRKWRKWVSEIKMPRSKVRIWLESYKTVRQAAHAYDDAMYCLRGRNAKLNFPDTMPTISSASSLSHQQIQDATTKYVLDKITLTLTSL